ncbi:MAG: hypothetical protein CMO65_06115 [Verrucomicrobiales bacterium]|nr:hypothetical protein [Verrucomicrobiales bacterium]
MSKRQPSTLMGTGTTRFAVAWMMVSFVGALSVVDSLAKDAQTIAIEKITTQKYGAKPFTVKAASTSKLPVSLFVNGPAVIKGGLLTIKGAGTVRIFALQAGDEQFKAAAPAMTSFLVEKAELTVKAEDKTMDEGGKEPELTLVYKGFVNGDTEKTLESPAKAKIVETGKGFRKKKQIVPSGAKSANYSFKYVTGDLKVTRKKKGLFGRK